MTASEIMTYIDEIKEDIPDGVYLTLANLLKKQEIDKINDNYKLVEICYITTRIRRRYEDVGEDEDYVVVTEFSTKKAYIDKNTSNIKQGNDFYFDNDEGLQLIVIDADKKERELYHHTNIENKITISYDKYVLVSIKDC